jgi:hypothetical protein
MKFYRYQGFGLSGLSNVAGQGLTQLNPSTKEQTTKMFKFSDKGLGPTSKINSQAQDPVMDLPNLKKDVMPVSKFSYKTDDGKVIEDHEFKPMNLDENMPSDSSVQSSENKLMDLANKIKPGNHSVSGPIGHGPMPAPPMPGAAPAMPADPSKEAAKLVQNMGYMPGDLKIYPEQMKQHDKNFSVGHQFVEEMFGSLGGQINYKSGQDANENMALRATASTKMGRGTFGTGVTSINQNNGMTKVYNRTTGESKEVPTDQASAYASGVAARNRVRASMGLR